MKYTSWFCALVLIFSGCKENHEKMHQQVIKKNGALILAPGELERAGEYIKRNLGEDRLKEIRTNVQLEGKKWLTSRHNSRLGLHIRNMLREGGFKWGVTVLDENWIDAVLLAIK